MYDAYIFDFDYTLANSEQGIINCFRNTIKKLGYKQPTDNQIKHTIGMSLHTAVPALLNENNPAEIEKFFQTFLSFADIYMTPGTIFFPESLPVLTQLKEQGKKIAIVSSKRRTRIMEKFTIDGAAHLVDLIIGCLEVKETKPSPEGLLLAAKTLGVAKDRILYIGDNTIDAAAAQNAGIAFAAVTTGTTTAEEFSAYPNIKIMQNLSELLQPFC